MEHKYNYTLKKGKYQLTNVTKSRTKNQHNAQHLAAVEYYDHTYMAAEMIIPAAYHENWKNDATENLLSEKPAYNKLRRIPFKETLLPIKIIY